MDDGTDTLRGARSLLRGPAPDVRICHGFDAEVDGIVEWLGAADTPLERACLVARTNPLRDRYGRALAARGVETYPLARSRAEDRTAPGLRLATMHRVKGLEFDRIVVAGLNADLVPWKHVVERSRDAAVRREAEERERALLYVALTRARWAALLSAHGEPSPWVRELP